MKRKPASILAYENKILDLQGKVESLARDLGKLNEATQNAREQRQAAAKEEDALRLLTIERKHEIASLDVQIAERKEVLVRNVKQSEGEVFALTLKRAVEEQALKTLQDAQKKFDAIHESAQRAKAVHDSILGEIEASRATLAATKSQVAAEEAKLVLIRQEEKDVVKNVTNRMNGVLVAGNSLKENYERMKFYGKRLKKHFMSHGLPFPEELADLDANVFFKNRALNEQHGKQ